jgi:hypothetical protein
MYRIRFCALRDVEGAGVFLICVLLTARGTIVFLIRKLLAKRGTRRPDSRWVCSLFAYCWLQKEQLCSALESYWPKEERAGRIQGGRVPYLHIAVGRRNNCVPHSKVIGRKRNAPAGFEAGVFLICVLLTAEGTIVFLIRKLLAERGTRRPDSGRACSLFVYRRRSGFRSSRSSTTNRPSLRTSSSSKYISPPPQSSRWIETRSQCSAL